MQRKYLCNYGIDVLEPKEYSRKSRDWVLHVRLLIKVKQKLGNLKVLVWPDNYAKPRSARPNVGDISDEDNMKK